ncbi:mhyt [Cordyceps fumosorosea ARSEF 2679]|uniref:Mhyt n=1 Tax=Cordyceps fumosorosea (strain ARSEF 2679) TaxID=1081104 RepID=A0A168BQ72_CORFA|nr:mhyt [Cordyceps fumosorosea ARSEF 2679]OAA70410.1 mhyt [Cordyceps fumosorosea ARSEF 2679]
MSSVDQLFDDYSGKTVPYSFHAGFVCLSYAVSLVGAGSTLELMRRRTSHKGLHNFVLLAGAAMCMGGIAIWSMHFIGNRALFIFDGQSDLQVAYSTGLTVASLFVPILVLLLAFLAVTNNDHVQWWKISLAGVLSGGAICGMHYLGNASISNYRCAYSVAYVIGAAIIAVSASTAALAVFFVFESSWKTAWWRRVLCAAVLAGAVSGMHWCAAVGTQYTLVGQRTGSGMSRDTTIIIVICLAIAAFVVTGACAVYSIIIKRSYANRAQQVVLGAAVFDKRGRILVTKEGLLPTELVTESLLLRSNDEIFDTNHPLFHWAYRASRNWSSVSNLISRMAVHVSQLARQRYSSSANLMQEDGSPIPDYDVVCCQLFSLAAASLAAKLRVNLAEVGVLWDEIFATGQTRPGMEGYNGEDKALGTTSKHTSKMADSDSLAEKAEVSRLEYGRGSLMVLVQHVPSRHVAEQLESAGYRFAELDQVVGFMRSSMQIKTPDLGLRLRQMAALDESETALAPGVHVGAFAIRARVDHTGFDVLVRRRGRDLLPTVPLPLQQLEQRHIGYLNHLQNQTMAVVADRLASSVSQHSDLGKFAATLLEGIKELRSTFEDDGTFDSALLMQHPIKIPYHGRDRASLSLSATVIMFQLVLPIHNVIHIPKCTFIPLRFFKVKQLAQENAPHHLDFSHAVHRDMSSVLQGSPSNPLRDVLERFKQKTRDTLPISSSAPAASKSGKRGRGRGGMRGGPGERSTSQSRLSPGKLEDNTSLNALSDVYSESEANGSSIHDGGAAQPRASDVEMASLNIPPPLSSPTKTFGGIMVSQEIVVETAELPGNLPPYSSGRRKSGVAVTISHSHQPDTITSSDSRSTAQDSTADLQITDSRVPPQRDVFSHSRHAADAFRAEQNGERQGAIYVDELLSLCMRKQVII